MDLVAEAKRRRAPLRILVTRLRYLGDVILTTPAVAALKRRYPAAEIYYCAERPYADILRHDPSLAGVIGLSKGVRGAVDAVRTLRSLRLTAAIDLFYNPRSAWLLFAAGIPVRAGGSRRMRRRLYTHVFTGSAETRSAVMHHLSALSVFGVDAPEALPRVFLSPEEFERGRELLGRAAGPGGENGAVIAMHPGGTWPSKRWPPESFARLARLARERFGARILLIGGPGEEDIVEHVRSSAGEGVAVLPAGDLRRTASIVASCAAVVANDGGIMHLAAALGVPTVGIFGPTEHDIWFPYEGKGPFALVTHKRECAPCHKHFCDDLSCLTAIEPPEVLGRVEEVLAWRGR